MTFWEYLNQVGERRAKLKLERPINTRLLANVIGCALVFGFLGAIVALCVIPVPVANKDLLTYMIGQLSGFAGGVVAYHYTMSASAKESAAASAATINKAVEGLKTAVESSAPVVPPVVAAPADDEAPPASGVPT